MPEFHKRTRPFARFRDLPRAGKYSDIIILESCIVMPSYFTSTEGQDKLTFFMRKRKEEAYKLSRLSSHVYEDTKSGDKQLRP